MKSINKILIASLLVFLAACGGNPEKAIVNHWVPEATEEENAWREEAPEFEFKKDGTANLYIDGNIVLSTKYTLATDGKSLVLNEPSGREAPMSLEIISLSAKRLEMVPITQNAFGSSGRGDTTVFIPKK